MKLKTDEGREQIAAQRRVAAKRARWLAVTKALGEAQRIGQRVRLGLLISDAERAALVLAEEVRRIRRGE